MPDTVWLRKKNGGTSIGPYDWPEDGAVAEVDEHFARGLLAIPDHDFEKVQGPDRYARTSAGSLDPTAADGNRGGSPGDSAADPDLSGGESSPDGDSAGPEPLPDAPAADPEPVAPAKRGPKPKA